MTLRSETFTPNILSVAMPWRAYILRVCSVPFFFNSAMMDATVVIGFPSLRISGSSEFRYSDIQLYRLFSCRRQNHCEAVLARRSNRLSLLTAGLRVHESQEGLAVIRTDGCELHPDSLSTFRPPHDS